MMFSEVQLYYFTDTNTPNCANDQTSNSSSTLSDRNLGNPVHSLISNGSIAVVVGHILLVNRFVLQTAYLVRPTLSSASVYLQILGTVPVSNECIIFGRTSTNTFMSSSLDVIVTWRPPSASDPRMSLATGDVWTDPFEARVLGVLHSLSTTWHVQTWGLGRSISADSSVIANIGAPWLPLIALSSELSSLGPI